MSQPEHTTDFSHRVASREVGISWLSYETFCCPHFICTVCSRPVTPDHPGIVIWRYAEDGGQDSVEYRIRHKGACDRAAERRENGHFWFWDDLDDVLDQLVYNTLGRKPPENPRAHRAFTPLPPEKVPSPKSPQARRPITPPISQDKRWRILMRDKWTCRKCKRSAELDGVALEVDHMQPRSKGGTNDDANLWTLCRDCNQGKRDQLP